MSVRWGATIMLVLVWSWSLSAGAAPALAHANLVRSEPAANSVLPDAPPAIQLWFSEQPEPRFSEITVYASDRTQLPVGAVQVAPEDRTSIVVTLDRRRTLAPGTYTGAWKALSAVDGHITAGAFAFAVGVGQTVSGPVSDVLVATGETTQATPGTTTLRWLTYLAMATLLGALAFAPLVAQPALAALQRVGDDTNLSRQQREGALAKGRSLREPWSAHVRMTVTRRTLQLALAGFWGTVALTLLAAVAQAAEAASVPLTHALSLAPDGPLLMLLLSTRYGQVWLGRLLLLSLVALVLSRLRATGQRPDRRQRTLWLVGLGLASLVPLTTSLNSHAAALAAGATPGAPLVPILADWIHLVATGCWVGGLCALALALPAGLAAAGQGRRTTLLGAAASAFSRVAVICVAALLLTGLYQSLLEVGSWGALFGTLYGRALAVKLALVAPLLLLGAFNLLVSGPRLGRAARAAVGLEDLHEAVPPPSAPSQAAGLGPGVGRAFRIAVWAETVLACAVLLAVGVMTSSEPAKPAWAAATRGVTLEQTAGDLRLRLRVNPAEPGFNAFTLTVREARGGRPVADAEKVALIVTMVEHDMGENELVLDNKGDGTYETASGLASMLGTWNGEALVRRRGRDDVRAPFSFKIGAPPAPPTGATSGAAPGAVGAPGTPVAPAEARFLKNPLPPTEESLVRGQQLYQQNCLVCHGPQGKGDGPAALALRPRPADLTQHVAAHTEGELWWWITNGVAGTQMPAWKNTLSDGERWDVLNYLVSAFSPTTR